MRWLILCALLACDSSDDPAPTALRGTLALEVLDSAEIVIEPRDGGLATVTLTPSLGFGVLEDGKTLSAEGRVEALPETTDTFYTARFSSPAVAGGPCGSEPVSLALSLHRAGANAYVGGGLSAYCGANVWYGIPVRVLRLAGPLPP